MIKYFLGIGGGLLFFIGVLYFLIDFSPKQFRVAQKKEISKIVILQKNQKLELNQAKNGDWQVEGQAELDKQKISELLLMLTSFQIYEEVDNPKITQLFQNRYSTLKVYKNIWNKFLKKKILKFEWVVDTSQGGRYIYARKNSYSPIYKLEAPTFLLGDHPLLSANEAHFLVDKILNLNPKEMVHVKVEFPKNPSQNFEIYQDSISPHDTSGKIMFLTSLSYLYYDQKVKHLDSVNQRLSFAQGYMEKYSITDEKGKLYEFLTYPKFDFLDEKPQLDPYKLWVVTTFGGDTLLVSYSMLKVIRRKIP